MIGVLSRRRINSISTLDRATDEFMSVFRPLFSRRNRLSNDGVADLVTRWNGRSDARSTIHSSAHERFWRVQRSCLILPPLDRPTAKGIVHIHHQRRRVAPYRTVAHVDRLGIATRSRRKSRETRMVSPCVQGRDSRGSSSAAGRRGGCVMRWRMM